MTTADLIAKALARKANSRPGGVAQRAGADFSHCSNSAVVSTAS
jgi:hypothetical protein